MRSTRATTFAQRERATHAFQVDLADPTALAAVRVRLVSGLGLGAVTTELIFLLTPASATYDRPLMAAEADHALYEAKGRGLELRGEHLDRRGHRLTPRAAEPLRAVCGGAPDADRQAFAAS